MPWQNTLDKFEVLYLGLSGGLDSTVLLHALSQNPALLNKLQALHIHHGLSQSADDWEEHCQQYCKKLGVPLLVRRVKIDSQSNIEESARLARYQVFSELLNPNDGLLLGHHQDDQAETVLLQLLRGSGIDGLSAMPEVKPLAKGVVLRPFLHHPRHILEAYANEHQLRWVEDESNQNNMFSRNFLRQRVIPLLKEKWPEAASNMARSASHCQQAKSNLQHLATIDCPNLFAEKNRLPLTGLQDLEYSRLVNIIRVWLQGNDTRLPSTKILNQVINDVILAREDATPVVQWGEVTLRRFKHALYILKHNANSPLSAQEWSAFPNSLKLENDHGSLVAELASEGVNIPIGSKVTIRYRQGGELFSWRGQTKQLKKLWQQWQVPPWQRDVTPLIYVNDKLAVIAGHAINDNFFSATADNTYCIQWLTNA